MKNKTTWLLIGFVFLTFFMPWLFLHNSHFSKYFDFSTQISNNIAATIGGLLSPLFSLFGSYLVYSALKEQQKSNKIAAMALKITRSQSDSAQILEQILVLENLKEVTKSNIEMLNYQINKKLDLMILYYNEERTAMNKVVLENMQLIILRYVNEFEITLELIQKSEMNKDIFYKKLFFTHNSIDKLLIAYLISLDKALNEMLVIEKTTSEERDPLIIPALVSKFTNMKNTLAGSINSYQVLDLNKMILA